jgi:hypothetical protein
MTLASCYILSFDPVLTLTNHPITSNLFTFNLVPQNTEPFNKQNNSMDTPPSPKVSDPPKSYPRRWIRRVSEDKYRRLKIHEDRITERVTKDAELKTEIQRLNKELGSAYNALRDSQWSADQQEQLWNQDVSVWYKKLCGKQARGLSGSLGKDGLGWDILG